MKRTTYLKVMGVGWCIPQFVVIAPFALTAIAIAYVADLFVWLEGKATNVSAKVGTALYPPSWWPSHRYMDELEKIRAERRRETVDRLHSQVSRSGKVKEAQ